MAALVLLACSAWIVPAAEAPKPDAADQARYKDVKLDGELDFTELALLAVQHGGRKKPLHTLAVESIEQLTGRRFFLATPYWKDPATGNYVSALDAYLSLWIDTRDWTRQPVVLVANGLLRRETGLSEEEKRFTFDDLVGNAKFQALYESGKKKRQEKKSAEMTDLEKEAEVVADRLYLMRDIMHGATVNCIPHPSDPNGTWISPQALAAIFSSPKAAVELVAEDYTHGDRERAEKIVAEYAGHYSADQVDGALLKLQAVLKAYKHRDAAAFSQASLDLRRTLLELSPGVYPALEQLDREVSYNNLRPFGKAWIFYLAALVFGALTFKVKHQAAYAALFMLFLGGVAIHVYGFALRCLIAGRPPVSNMFESVIWVGFGVVAFGLIFELIYRPKYFLLCGAAGGFFCLVLMDLMPVVLGNSMLPGFESHINPLVPVLRDNFWLTVHVLTITLSYAAYALAWVLAHVTLYKHLVHPEAKHEHHLLHQFIYRVIQVGVLLLATGTILGGVWAYYSWGRFWGWDPKETWAFITLLCYLVVLHGRFTGLWGNFGLCVGAVVCFQSVAMAWYGVNFVLGNGLHAYASGAGGEEYVFPFLAVDALFTAAAVYRYTSYKRDNAESKLAQAVNDADPEEGDAPVSAAAEPAPVGK
ncbi:MAG: cytochrome c biogenesis protein CcsA [Planctomycetes bacterium]|nr:cytochrome c biogenesis protein CcsA [Planctomycetota bacterium]